MDHRNARSVTDLAMLDLDDEQRQRLTEILEAQFALIAGNASAAQDILKAAISSRRGRDGPDRSGQDCEVEVH
jgi:hypothetical protein